MTTQRCYHQNWSLADEKKFIYSIGDHAPNLVTDKTMIEWLEAYIAANTLSGLAEQPWREEAIAYARKRLNYINKPQH